MDLEEEFHQAVGNGDAEKVGQMLSTGFRCHGTNKDDEYPMWVAAKQGNVRILEALVEAGETPKLGPGNRSALFMATEHGHADAVAFLGRRFDALVTLESYTKDHTPFICAVHNGFVQVVKVLLELGASVEDKHHTNRRNALIIAVKNGDEEMVRVLLETKIDIDEFDGCEKTALHRAVENRNLRIAEMLLKAGATSSISRSSDPSAFEIAARDGYTSGLELMTQYDNAFRNPIGKAIEWSVRYGRVGATKFLLGFGADPNHRFPDDDALFEKCRGDEGLKITEMLVEAGANPNAVSKWRPFLHFAVARGWPTLVRKLIDSGAEVDIRDRDHNTPLINASYNGVAEMVKNLIDAGADPNAINKNHKTALWWAARNTNADATKMLLDAGADPNFQAYGNYPLHKAVERDSVEITKLLLDAGADVDADDDINDVYIDSEHYVLGIATKRKNSAMVDLLLGAGANPNFGFAFYRAIKRQDENLVKKLLDHGTDPNAPCEGDMTPLSVAWARRADNIIKLLLQAGADPTTFNPRIMRVGGDPAKTHASVVMMRNQPRVPTLSILCLRIIKLKRNGVQIPAWLPSIVLAFPWEWEREDDEDSKRPRDESGEESDSKRQK